MTDVHLTDRVLAIMQQRFAAQFEICVLQAQNEALQARLAEVEASDDEP
jgi:hypothetical protein